MEDKMERNPIKIRVTRLLVVDITLLFSWNGSIEAPPIHAAFVSGLHDMTMLLDLFPLPTAAGDSGSPFSYMVNWSALLRLIRGPIKTRDGARQGKSQICSRISPLVRHEVLKCYWRVLLQFFGGTSIVTFGIYQLPFRLLLFRL